MTVKPVVENVVEGPNNRKEEKFSQGTGVMDRVKKFSRKERDCSFEEWKKACQISKQERREVKQLDRGEEQCSTTEEITKERPFMRHGKRKAEQEVR